MNESKFAVRLNSENDSIVLKRYDCDAFDFANALNILSQYSYEIMKQMIDGVAFLHENQVIHGDIKLGNFLVKIKEDKVVKCKKLLAEDLKNGFYLAVSDFGGAVIYNNKKIKNLTGSPKYIAPEVEFLFEDKNNSYEFKDYHKNGYDYKADVYSLGVTMLLLETNLDVFSKNSNLEDYKAVKKIIWQSRNNLVEGKMKKLLNSMLNRNPIKRPSISEVQNSFKEILEERSKISSK